MGIQYYRQPEVPPAYPPLAARAGDFVFYGGGIAAHPLRGMPPELRARRGFPHHGSDVDRQLRYVYDTMSQTLEDAGSSIKQIMKINAFHTDPAGIDAAIKLRGSISTSTIRRRARWCWCRRRRCRMRW